MTSDPTIRSRAFWTWLLLSDLAARGSDSTAYDRNWPGRITYSALAARVGGTAAEIGPTVLEEIASYCEQGKLPPLSGLVVGKDSGKPGAGFRQPDQLPDIYTFKWERVDNPFA